MYNEPIFANSHPQFGNKNITQHNILPSVHYHHQRVEKNKQTSLFPFPPRPVHAKQIINFHKERNL
jgi:hypothetical protein